MKQFDAVALVKCLLPLYSETKNSRYLTRKLKTVSLVAAMTNSGLNIL